MSGPDKMRHLNPIPLENESMTLNITNAIQNKEIHYYLINDIDTVRRNLFVQLAIREK